MFSLLHVHQNLIFLFIFKIITFFLQIYDLTFNLLFWHKNKLLATNCFQKKKFKIFNIKNLVSYILRSKGFKHFLKQEKIFIIMQILFHNVNPHGYFKDFCDKVKWIEQNTNECKHMPTITSLQICMFVWRKKSYKNDVNANAKYEINHEFHKFWKHFEWHYLKKLLRTLFWSYEFLGVFIIMLKWSTMLKILFKK